jgi:hypothetical protein
LCDATSQTILQHNVKYVNNFFLPSPILGVKKHQAHHHKDDGQNDEIGHYARQLSRENVDTHGRYHQADYRAFYELVTVVHDFLPIMTTRLCRAAWFEDRRPPSY